MRFPFAPLERILVVQLGPRLASNGQDAGKTRLLAEALEVDRAQVNRWRKFGVTVDQAETLAIKAGYVPYEVWPEWLEDASLTCPHCSTPFVPHDSRQRFCRRDCQRRFNYTTDTRRTKGRETMARIRERPEAREANRAYAEQYRSANKSKSAIHVKPQVNGYEGPEVSPATPATSWDNDGMENVA